MSPMVGSRPILRCPRTTEERPPTTSRPLRVLHHGLMHAPARVDRPHSGTYDLRVLCDHQEPPRSEGTMRLRLGRNDSTAAPRGVETAASPGFFLPRIGWAAHGPGTEAAVSQGFDGDQDGSIPSTSPWGQSVELEATQLILPWSIGDPNIDTFPRHEWKWIAHHEQTQLTAQGVPGVWFYGVCRTPVPIAVSRAVSAAPGKGP